jgi:hypothetical protein
VRDRQRAVPACASSRASPPCTTWSRRSTGRSPKGATRSTRSRPASRRLDHRRAQAARDADHRRARAPPARGLLRRDRLPAAGGRLDMNIPIRTTLVADGELRFYAAAASSPTPRPRTSSRRPRPRSRRSAAPSRAFPSARRGERMKEKAALRASCIARRDALPEARAARTRASLTAALAALPQYAARARCSRP